MPDPVTPSYRRILLTGAAGRLGTILRPMLAARTLLRSGDLRAVGGLHPGEEAVQFDLADFDAVRGAVEGCDCVIHFGGIPLEAAFAAIRDTNITGTYNVFEAARQAGVRRIINASTHHVSGYVPIGQGWDADAPVRPDSLYGVSKAFSEALGRFYWDRHGIEHASLRIGIAVPKPYDRRSLGLWLSEGDLCRLVQSCLDVPRLGFTVLVGQSANTRAWLTHASAAHVGYAPGDDAEHFVAEVPAADASADAGDPAQFFTGGYFTSANPPQWEGPDMVFVPHRFAAAATKPS